MSNSRSDSSESLSIYETPINSPSNESLLGSTRIDSSLFGNTSANTQSIDFTDFRQSFESIPTSIATESTLRQTVQRLNSECGEDNQLYPHSTRASIPETSLPSQTMSSFRNQMFDTNGSDPYALFLSYMSELEGEQLELIGVEQQLQSLSLKCRTIRENMTSKTNAMNLLITEMLPKKKQTAQKQTQTDIKETSVPETCDQNKSSQSQTSQDLLKPKFFPKSINSVISEPNICAETTSPEHNFCILSEGLKNGFHRLPALVKGYLTRRLMKTEKVLHKIKTIRDTTQLLSNYRNTSNKRVTAEDIDFHKRLIIQLESSCHEFYDIFFNYPKSSQMALISHSRQHILERHYRTASVLSNSIYLNESFRNQGSPQTNALSSVTKKVIQRKALKNRTNVSQMTSSHSKSSLSNSAKSPNRSHPLVSNSPFRRRSQRNIAANRTTTVSHSVQTHKRKANFDK